MATSAVSLPPGYTVEHAPQSVSGLPSGYTVEQPPSEAASVKMVSPEGQAHLVKPSEVKNFQSQGHTRINPDGSFDLQNIFGEDPLEEQKRYQRVRQALSTDEKAAANRAELKQFGKAGVAATIATAAGAAGAGPIAGGIQSAVAPSVVPVAGGAGFGGAAPTTALGPSAIGGAASWAARQLAEHAIKATVGGAVGGAIITKLMHLW